MKPSCDTVLISNDGAYDVRFTGLIAGRLPRTVRADIFTAPVLVSEAPFSLVLVRSIERGGQIAPGGSAQYLDIFDEAKHLYHIVAGRLICTRIEFHPLWRKSYAINFVTIVHDA